MNEKVMIVQMYQQAIVISQKERCLYLYDYIAHKIIKSSKGRLLCTNSELAKMLESHFGIALADYGVEVKDEYQIVRFKN